MENNSENHTEENGVGVQIHYGKAAKSFSEMTEEEQNIVGDHLLAAAKEINFKHGLPITSEVDGFVVQEYSDGRIIKLKAITVSSKNE